MTNQGSFSEKLSTGALCCVCEDIASGRHYGVPSCSGCKTFFRRAITNNRAFKCLGNGRCPVNKDVRCACRCCRLLKCLSVGMKRDAIQNARDRIGYTKRTKRDKKQPEIVSKVVNNEDDFAASGNIEDGSAFNTLGTSQVTCDMSLPSDSGSGSNSSPSTMDPMLERLTVLENNFSLLLSRAEISSYASLDEALSAPTIFAKPITVSINDPIATPKLDKRQGKMPFWRSRIITLYVDWAKTFNVFRNLPYTDKVALITNHASSFMIMCEAFRTPERISPDSVSSTLHYFGGVCPSTGILYKSPPGSNKAEHPEEIKMERSKHVPLNAAGTEEDDRYRLSDNVHEIFDPTLISSGETCALTGIKSIVDVPPSSDYPNIGSFSGLAPVMAAMISYVMKPFRRLNITTTEFATLQAVCFFDPDTEGLDSASQRNVAAEQEKLLSALYSHICKHYDPSAATERYTSIILRIPTIRKVAAKKNESLQIIDMFNSFSLNSLIKETALGIRQQPNNSPSNMKYRDN